MKTIGDIRMLEAREREHLTALPIYIAVLIAGADGNIDDSELKKAIDFSKLAEESCNSEIVEFYGEVNHDFEDKLKVVVANLPYHKEEIKKYLIDQLQQGNQILAKIDKQIAKALYESFKALARNIAAASGGILGFGSISREESQLVTLQMIHNPA